MLKLNGGTIDLRTSSPLLGVDAGAVLTHSIPDTQVVIRPIATTTDARLTELSPTGVIAATLTYLAGVVTLTGTINAGRIGTAGESSLEIPAAVRTHHTVLRRSLVKTDRTITLIFTGLRGHVDAHPVIADLVTATDLRLQQNAASLAILLTPLNGVADANRLIELLTLIHAVVALFLAHAVGTPALCIAGARDTPIKTIIGIALAGTHREGTHTFCGSLTRVYTVV